MDIRTIEQQARKALASSKDTLLLGVAKVCQRLGVEVWVFIQPYDPKTRRDRGPKWTFMTGRIDA